MIPILEWINFEKQNMDNKEHREQELWEKIIKYLKGELNAQEKNDFEKTIQADRELAKEVERNRMIYEALHNADILDAKEKVLDTMALIKDISATVPVDFDQLGKVQPKKFTGKIWPPILGIAATVLLIMAAIFVFRQYSTSPSLDSQVTAYLNEPYQSPPFYRGPEAALGPWAIHYEKGEYQEAISTLENNMATGDPGPEASFYLGLSYLYLEEPDPENAAIQFNRVLDSDNRYREQALWYLSLAYILDEQQNLAVETLEKITGFKKNEALELLDKLEE